jgi:peptidoglycan DL-endopeptidase CwlO
MASHRAPKTSTRAAAFTVVGLTAGTVALVPNLSEAAPAQTFDQVKTEVANLDVQSEAATQKYDEAQSQYAVLQQKIDTLQGQITTQTGALNQLQQAMGLQAGSQYEGGGISPALQLALTTTPDAFLSQASAANETSQQEVVRLKQIDQTEVVLKQDKANAAALMAQQQTTLKQLAANKSTVQKELNQAQNLLSSLTPVQKAQVEGGGGDGGSGSSTYNGVLPPVSGRAAAAIAYARSKIGDPYEYATNGPNTFDCSGLVQASWKAAGVSIERDSYEQWSSLPHITQAELEPGDLVFYYGSSAGPGHVAMYIGNGEIIQALHTGTDIMYSPMLGQMPLVGFARVV